MKQDSCQTDKQISVRTRNGSTSCGDGIGISKESTNILDPLVAHSKGRPPFKRKQSMVEKVTKKKKRRKKEDSWPNLQGKCAQTYCEKSEEGCGELQDNGNMHGARVVELNSEMQQSLHIEQESYDYNRGLGMWPNMTSHPSIIGMSPYFGQPIYYKEEVRHFKQGHHHPSPSWRANLEMGGVMLPNNFTEMLTMNDMAQAKTPTLHKDDKSEEH
ncbi:hypothetical protein ACSBR2_012156 [Camellia fascicularis]